VNILNSSSQTTSDRVAHLRFDFELADPSHLDSLLKAVARVDSVYEAYRILPGGSVVAPSPTVPATT
jgi:GTP diphosphokinase / guanosine-3',5'-bis(diphosphate) 3'-diphosphatase